MYLVDSLTLSSKNTIVIILLGLILVGFGVFLFKTGVFNNNTKVEVLNSTTETQNSSQEIVVEIAGSVEKPAVYKLPQNSRVDDLLIVAGGLSVDADRGWVEKNINRASLLKDGQKIYIYSQSEVGSAKESGGIKLDQVVLGASDSHLVNINTASLSELDKLSGIGPVYGQRIIDGRIYSNVEELVKKDIIPQKTYDKIKNLITAY